MSWSVLQSACSGPVAGGPASVASTYGSNLTSGSKLIAICGVNVGFASSAVPTAVKDANSNAFTQIAATPSTNLTTYNPSVSAWVLDTPSGDAGTKPAITATLPGGIDSAWILIHEVSGLAAGTTASVDGTPAAPNEQAAAASMPQPSYSSTAANELLYSLGAQAGWNATLAISGYTLDSNSPQPGSSCQGQVAYANSTGGAESGTWTTSYAGAEYTAFVVLAFKLAGAGPSFTALPNRPRGQAVNRASTY